MVGGLCFRKEFAFAFLFVFVFAFAFVTTTSGIFSAILMVLGFFFVGDAATMGVSLLFSELEFKLLFSLVFTFALSLSFAFGFTFEVGISSFPLGSILVVVVVVFSNAFGFISTFLTGSTCSFSDWVFSFRTSVSVTGEEREEEGGRGSCEPCGMSLVINTFSLEDMEVEVTVLFSLVRFVIVLCNKVNVCCCCVSSAAFAFAFAFALEFVEEREGLGLGLGLELG